MAGRPTGPRGHVKVGQIVGAFGLKGGLKVVPLTEFAERFDIGSLLYLNGEPREILDLHWHKGQARLSLEGVATVEDAEDLQWQYLTIPETDRPELGQDEFLASDLVGMSVVEDGREIGKVTDVVGAPAHDLLVVDGAMIPLVREFVKTVDLKARTITVVLIPGMRPGESAEEVR
jgi:16S rRNA processing protein RimM